MSKLHLLPVYSMYVYIYMYTCMYMYMELKTVASLYIVYCPESDSLCYHALGHVIGSVVSIDSMLHLSFYSHVVSGK